MGEFVSDQGSLPTCAKNGGGCQKREARVFHPTIWKGWRQDEQIIASPQIGTEQLFSLEDLHLILGEFPGRRLDGLWLGIDTCARTQFTEGKIPDRQRKQIGWNRLGHLESECGPFPFLDLEQLSRHYSHQLLRHFQIG